MALALGLPACSFAAGGNPVLPPAGPETWESVGAWSEAKNGLRVRAELSFRQVDEVHNEVVAYLELQNVSNLGNDMRIPWGLGDHPLSFELVDAKGAIVSPGPSAIDLEEINREFITLPYDSNLRFVLNQSGRGLPAEPRKVLLNFGPGWIVDRDQDGTYFLRTKLEVASVVRHPAQGIWQGTIDIPKVKIDPHDWPEREKILKSRQGL